MPCGAISGVTREFVHFNCGMEGERTKTVLQKDVQCLNRLTLLSEFRIRRRESAARFSTQQVPDRDKGVDHRIASKPDLINSMPKYDCVRCLNKDTRGDDFEISGGDRNQTD